MIYENKKFQVKEYSDFPYKKDNDRVVKECKDLETARFEQKWYSGRARMGERYYVIDTPHKWIELSNNEKERLRRRFPQAIGK